MFGDPVTNSKGWEKVSLNELGELSRGKSKHRPRNAPELLGGPYPLVQTGDIANAGIYLKEYTQTYSEFGLKQSKMWNKGTLCITIAANIAKTSILTFDACFPDSVVAFIPNEKTNNMFIQFWMSFLQKILEDSAPESAQKNINLKILSEQKVIVPPIELQNQFADFVEQVDKLKFEFWILKLKMEKWVYNILIYDIERSDLEMEKSIDYNSFLQVLNETKGIHNSLNELLKYDFIYHSNKIEGSTFTTEALQLLFEKNIVTGTHTLDDVQETVNSFYTFDLVIESIDKELTLDMIKEWHSSLMYRTRLYDLGLAGVFKKYQNKIYGADFDTANPWEVEDNLNALIEEYYSLEKATIEDIAKFHLEFERIHPFQDGNGRIGRFIYLKQLLENRLALKYMNGETSSDYKNALGLSSSNNIKPLVEYINKQKDFIIENKNMF